MLRLAKWMCLRNTTFKEYKETYLKWKKPSKELDIFSEIMSKEKQIDIERDLSKVTEELNKLGKKIRKLEGRFINKEKEVHHYVLKLIEADWNLERAR